MNENEKIFTSLICYDCGTTVSGIREGRTTIVIDTETGKWIHECPECECEDFYAEGEEYVSHYRY